jgi:hypothetical protein
MKNLALGVLFAGLAAACGGGKKVNLIDAPPADAGVCNPLTQAGCAAGEKCSWIIDDATADIGHIGCAPDGTVAIGGACMNAGGVGPDDCVAGSVCVAAECKAICDPMAAAAASGCDAQHACSRYSGLFEQGGMILYGACDPAADPLTQKLLAGTGSLEACGSTTATAPNKGAYTFDFNVFTCAPVGTQTLTLTDRQPPRTDSAGNPFVNGCAPGWMPFFLEKTGSTKALCTGLCAPVKTDITAPGKVSGDPAVLGKLPADATAVAGHAVCKPNIKGSVVAGNNENCLFLWGFITNMDGSVGPSQYNDTLGVCFDYNQFTYDATGNTPDMGQNYPNPGIATQPIPSCDKLAAKGTAMVAMNSESFINGDASQWLCYNSVDSMAFAADKNPKQHLNPALKNFRIGYGAGVAYRPTLVTK